MSQDNRPKKASEIPVNQAMLFNVRDELKSDINSLEHKMDSRFKEVDARMSSMDARMSNIDARMDSMEASISRMSASMSKMEASMHKLNLSMETQASENRYVMDHLTNIYLRQDKVEKISEDFENWIKNFRKSDK